MSIEPFVIRVEFETKYAVSIFVNSNRVWRLESFEGFSPYIELPNQIYFGLRTSIASIMAILDTDEINYLVQWVIFDNQINTSASVSRVLVSEFVLQFHSQVMKDELKS